MKKLMIIALIALTLVTGVNAEAKSVKVDGVDNKITVTTKGNKMTVKSNGKLSLDEDNKVLWCTTKMAYKAKKDLNYQVKVVKASEKATDKSATEYHKMILADQDDTIGSVNIAGIPVDEEMAIRYAGADRFSKKSDVRSFEQFLAYKRIVRRFYDDNNGFAGMSEFDKTYTAIALVQRGCSYYYNAKDNGGWVKFENAVYNGGNRLKTMCEGGSEMAAILMESTGLDKGSCGVATSDNLNHAWNFLMIDGKMYEASWQSMDLGKNWELYNSQDPEIKADADYAATEDSLLGKNVRDARSMSKGLYVWTCAERDGDDYWKQTDTEYHCVVKNGKHVGYSNAWMSGHEDKAHKLTYNK